MDLLAILLACSFHPDDQLVGALVDVQSRDNVYFVGDLATLESRDGLGSAEAALAFAEGIEKKGGRPAVGLLGVPLAWARRYGIPPISLFDACTNIAVGTAALDGYRSDCQPTRSRKASRGTPRRLRRDAAAARACILTAFGKELGVSAAPSAILARLAPGRTDPTSDGRDEGPSARSPVFSEAARGPNDAASANLLFFERQISPTSSR